MTRTMLPSRRPNITEKIEFDGVTVFVTLGFDPATGKVMEVFGDAAKQTSATQYLMADACVMISIALQREANVWELWKSCSRRPVIGVEGEHEEPASLIGKILQVIASVEVDLQPEPEL